MVILMTRAARGGVSWRRRLLCGATKPLKTGGAFSRSGHRLRIVKNRGSLPGPGGAREGAPRILASGSPLLHPPRPGSGWLEPVKLPPTRVHGTADDAVFPAPHQPGAPTSIQACQWALHSDHDGRRPNRAAFRQSLSPVFCWPGSARRQSAPKAARWFWDRRSAGSCAGWAWLQSGVAAVANARGSATR